ncbi:hypothetical protein C1645_837458 [Glomus cerebriforme]|uniref:Uncharacterized protein n=1 Tax=Glomus cerebriforme TaxID=658196 RepID=A0A397S404_9GLOM|nr:hypothetical protein C1645_837458 [Glomus cerebriforme]
MAVAIKQISNYLVLDPDFKKNCISIFNKRWAQFDTDTYLVAFFLHPKYRAAMKIWSKFGSNENGCKILLSQLRSYSEYNPPYDMEYTDAMINNDDLFIENEEDDIDSDDESIDLNEDDANNDFKQTL